MISRKSAVGIDVEQIKDKVERIAHKFMRPAELDFIDQQNRIAQLYVCWCAKEAIYKCYGQREVSFVDNIILEPFNFEEKGLVTARLKNDDVDFNYTVGYLQYEDYMIGYVKG